MDTTCRLRSGDAGDLLTMRRALLLALGLGAIAVASHACIVNDLEGKK